MDNELQNEMPIQEEGQKKKESGYTFWIILTLILAAFLGFRFWFFNNYGGVQVDGESMMQTLQDGQMLVMEFVEDGKGLERGDIIVVSVGHYEEFQTSNVQYVIKRLIAVEGDKVRCTDGQVEICYAGTQEYVPLPEDYAYYSGSKVGQDIYDYDFAEYVVGEGEIFFLGDNRLNSCDSRYQERGGSHLKDKLYKATDVYGIVHDWALEYRQILETIFL